MVPAGRVRSERRAPGKVMAGVLIGRLCRFRLAAGVAATGGACLLLGTHRFSVMAAAKNAASIYDFTCRDIDGSEVPLSKYEDQVCIIVNVASK